MSAPTTAEASVAMPDAKAGLLRSLGIELDRGSLSSDLVAGLTTAVMLIPQGMGYAMLAGLPPIYGLYSALLPLVVYAALGSSRQLAVGPVAMVSLLVAAGVGAIAETGSDAFVAYAILLALMVGVLQAGMGVARLGFLVNFLSHPVISGFTSAAAIIIGASQLKHLMGVSIPRSSSVVEVFSGAAAHAAETNLVTFAIGSGAIAALVLLKRYAPKAPRALIVVVASTLVVWGFGLYQQGVGIVGDVPAGLPALTLPTMNFEVMRELLPTAIAISLVGFMESVAVAKRFARQNGYEVNANRELVGLGLANLLGSFTSAFPTTGGFSRTAVNAQAGAKTRLAGVITAAVVMLTLVALTPLFHFLPKAVLAAIIMTAVIGLIDLEEVRHLWKVSRRDLGLLGLTFVATLGLGIEEGILVGVGASLVALVGRRLSQRRELPGADLWRAGEALEAGTAAAPRGLRLATQVHFGNAADLKERCRAEAAASPEAPLLLDASQTICIDASGEAALRELLTELGDRGPALWISGLEGAGRDLLQRAGLLEPASELPAELREVAGRTQGHRLVATAH